MKHYIGYGLLILASSMLTGCFTQAIKPVVVAPEPAAPVYPRPGKPQPLAPKFMVLGEEHEGSCGAVIKQNEALVCQSPQEYKVLARGFSQIIGYLHELEALIEVYERERLERNERISKAADRKPEADEESTERGVVSFEGPVLDPD